MMTARSTTNDDDDRSAGLSLSRSFVFLCNVLIAWPFFFFFLLLYHKKNLIFFFCLFPWRASETKAIIHLHIQSNQLTMLHGRDE